MLGVIRTAAHYVSEIRYGNYGGVNWTGGQEVRPDEQASYEVAPMDGLDAVFALHDKAYDEAHITAGTPGCQPDKLAADLKLLRDLEQVQPDTWWGKVYKGAAQAVFQASTRQCDLDTGMTVASNGGAGP